MTRTAASSPAATSICGILALASSDPTSSRRGMTSGPSGIGEHLAVGHVGDAVRNPLAKPHQRPDTGPARSGHRAVPCDGSARASRPIGGMTRSGRDLADDGGERREQRPLLVAELRFVGQVLEAASAAALVEPASRLDPVRRRLDDLLHHGLVEVPAPLHAPADDLLARQRAVDEGGLAAGTADAAAPWGRGRAECARCRCRRRRQPVRHWMLRFGPRAHDVCPGPEELREMVAVHPPATRRAPTSHSRSYAFRGEAPAHQLVAQKDEERIQRVDFAVRPDPVDFSRANPSHTPEPSIPSFPGKPSICAISSRGANARDW